MSQRSEHVILLHGILCCPWSMGRIARALREAGFVTHNVGYPSRTSRIADLADRAIGPALRACAEGGAGAVHFVTHSMGGILVRSYFARHGLPEGLGRVVMLVPPNHGSEVIDGYLRVPLLGRVFRKVVGPAGLEIGTGADSLPRQLGAANFELGVLAGSRSSNWLHSVAFLPKDNDGQVSLASTRLDGMRGHRVVRASHMTILYRRETARLVLNFLRRGSFDDAA